MSSFAFSTKVPKAWDEMCDQCDALFGTRGWQHILEQSFKCQTIYAIGHNTGVAITIFRAGPFHVGYLGFPIGNVIGRGGSITTLINELRRAGLRESPTCLRISVSGFGSTFQPAASAPTNPETAITNLQNWTLDAVSKRLRRDVRRATRSGLSISEATDRDVADDIYEIYAQTVTTHGGDLRYNAAYFHGLIELSRQQKRMRILLAHMDGQLAGFAITVDHSGTSYYLHGGTKTEYRYAGPSDLLLSSAIQIAKDDGNTCFNLMASPPDQPTLVRYKEKWGGETRLLSTNTYAIRWTYPLYRVAERLYQLAR